MTMHTRVSAKGQVVIPKQLRERLDLVAGTELIVEESGDGIFLRPLHRSAGRLTLDEFISRRPRYEGPRVSIDEMNMEIERQAARRWTKEESDRRRG